MNVLVIGGGKVGYYLTKTLLEHGHYPTIIEINKEVCKRLANELDIPVHCGDGTTIEALEAAHIEKMDAVISISGRDEDNLIACQLAKMMFHVPQTVTRVNNPKNADVMRQLGVDIVISATDNIARLLEREVDTSAIKQLVSLQAGESAISEIQIPSHYKLDGITLNELRISDEAIIISITRNNEAIIPRGNTQILSGDKILIMAKNKSLHQLKSMLKLD
jgi:trk system potassium uptake protein TrkA